MGSFFRWLYYADRARWERLTAKGKAAQREQSRYHRVVAVHRWRKKGWSQQQIAQRLGVSVRTVKRYVQGHPRASKQEQARSLAAEGLSQRAIADRLHVPRRTVRRWLAEGA